MTRAAEPAGLTPATQLTLTRQLACPPADVFAAWADPAARAIWSAPTPDIVIVYDAADFTVGGQDALRCIEADGMVTLAEVVYHDIVENRRIVFAECISRDGERIAAALITAEFVALDGGCRLTVTLQLVSLDAAGMGANYRQGWSMALDNLPLWLARADAGGVA